MAELRKLDAEPLGRGIDGLIDQLREYHEAGQLSGVAVAVVFRDGTTYRGFSDLPNSSTMLGAVERLRYALVRRLEDD